MNESKGKEKRNRSHKTYKSLRVSSLIWKQWINCAHSHIRFDLMRPVSAVNNQPFLQFSNNSTSVFELNLVKSAIPF